MAKHYLHVLKLFLVKKKLLLICFTMLWCGIVAHAQIISTIAGTGVSGYNGDHIRATSAKVCFPYGVAADSPVTVYIADRGNSRIRKIDLNGNIITIGGTDTIGYNGDGIPATLANLNGPVDVAVDTRGNVYFSDEQNMRIRKITRDTIYTIAGTGFSGYTGDGGPATSAQIDGPLGLCVDKAGAVYFAADNNRLCKVATTGIITTIAGSAATWGYGGDGGPATAARFSGIEDVAVDKAGVIYIADYGNNRIRAISTSGIVTTFAGIGVAGYSGDGGAATLAKIDTPRRIAVDDSGNVYFTESHSRIRMVNRYGFIGTVTGTGVPGFSGDGGMASAALISWSFGIGVDGAGRIYFSDVIPNQRIRKIECCSTLGIDGPNKPGADAKITLSVFPNPASRCFTLALAATITETAKVTILNVTGEQIREYSTNSNGHLQIDASALKSGIYSVVVATPHGSAVDMLVVEN